jgi:lysophospholipase L1-like esterase
MPMTSQNIEQLDQNFASPKEEKELKYYDVQTWKIEGKGWQETERFFDRLPAKAKGVVPDAVLALSHHSAGICVRFITDSNIIEAEWLLYSDQVAMPHMPATGVSGLDLYVKDLNNKWRWTGSGRPYANDSRVQKGVLLNVTGAKIKKAREYMLYLPLYNGVDKITVGLESNAMLVTSPATSPCKPICFYGTSITQGGCASRPGMAYAAIIGRMLDKSIINLGFSGNGRAEKEMADLLAELDVSLYVIDCLPNIDANLVVERLETFINTILEKTKDVPILVVDHIQYQESVISNERDKRWRSTSRAMHKIVKKIQEHTPHLFLFDTPKRLLGSDGEATVDGTHPNDLGFVRMATSLAPVINNILASYKC